MVVPGQRQGHELVLKLVVGQRPSILVARFEKHLEEDVVALVAARVVAAPGDLPMRIASTRWRARRNIPQGLRQPRSRRSHGTNMTTTSRSKISVHTDKLLEPPRPGDLLDLDVVVMFVPWLQRGLGGRTC